MQVIHMSVENFMWAINRIRTFNRLKHANLRNYNYKTILVNTPRSGLDANVIKIAQKYPDILYVSCNLQILCANLVTS